jgi:surface antigen
MGNRRVKRLDCVILLTAWHDVAAQGRVKDNMRIDQEIEAAVCRVEQDGLATTGVGTLGRGRLNLWMRGVVAIGLIGACTAVAAAGWVSVLKGTAAESFQDEELRMFLDAARQALNSEGPPKPVDWANADHSIGGSFLVVGESVGSGGVPCKRVRFSTYAPNYRKSTSTWTACKSSDGRWHLAGTK